MKEDIAIIGMSCRFPGAESVKSYWDNLSKGKDCIEELSDNDLRKNNITETLYSASNYVKKASHIGNIKSFDASFFEYSPREATLLDPQQRIMLELCSESLESSGYNPQNDTTDVGVFLGAGYNQYLIKNILRGRTINDSSENFLIQTSNDKDYLATRVSYKLNLKGPSIGIQTACSTSLVAVHFAVKSLLDGDCEMAMAGGITLRIPQKGGYFYEPDMIVSSDGKCRPFDKNASGTVFGSGGGVVVLKRLNDAIENNDNILCIIKGSAINNDGSSKVGYTAPSVKGQKEVIKKALKNAEVDAETISAIEAHGTATIMGDPIEFEALDSIFGGTKRKCAIGSVKGNIGHIENAAGIAGLIKMVLCLKNKYLVPSINFKTPNPYINIANSSLFINTKTTHWFSENKVPLRCGVSSFGIGGTNAHIVMEEFNSLDDCNKKEQNPKYYPINLSAKTPESLIKNKEALYEYIQLNKNVNISDLSYSLNLRRKAYPYRLSLSCRTPQEIESELKSSYNRNIKATADSDIVFLFPGQGTQYKSMGKELYEQAEVFKKEIDRCNEITKSLEGIDIISILYRDEVNIDINDTKNAQPVLFAIQYALGKQLIHWGILPNVMIGHSIGEYAAFCLSGIIKLKDAIKIVLKRASLMQSVNEGEMYSVNAQKKEIAPFLAGDNISIAALNSKDLLVISGKSEQVSKLLLLLDQRSIAYKKLHTSCAFHSCLMDSILDDFHKSALDIQYNPSENRIISTLTGDFIEIGESISADYLTKQIRQTVRFQDAITSIYNKENAVFIEIGAGNTLTTFVKQADYTTKCVCTIQGAKSAGNSEKFLINALCLLWQFGVNIKWETFFYKKQKFLADLPTYKFNKKDYWIYPLEVSSEVTVGNDSIYDIEHNEIDRTAIDDYSKTDFSVKEEQLHNIFSTILGIKNLRLNDNFFELGGHSLLATKIVTKINNTFDCHLKLKDFVKSPTIKGVANILTDDDETEIANELPSFISDDENRDEVFPLTEMQEAQWLGRISAFDTGGVAAHVYFEVEKEGLSPELISKSWQKLVNRHDMLRAVVEEDGTQKILPLPLEYKMKINYFEGFTNDEIKKKLTEIRENIDHSVRKLDKWPLFDVQCSVLPNKIVRIHFSLDLIICDVASLRILMQEWASYYLNINKRLPDIDISFRDYVFAEKKIKQTDLYKDAESYWTNKVKKIPGRPELPVKNIQNEKLNYKRVSHFIPKKEWEHLKKIASKQNVSPSVLFLGAFSEILGIWSQTKEFCINTTIINRHPFHKDVNKMVGEFASFAPLHVKLDENKSFAQLIKEIEEENWNNLENRYYHGTSILRKIASLKGETSGAVLPIVFTSTLVHSSFGQDFFHKTFGEYGYVVSQTPQVWLDHAIFESAGGLMLSWHFIENIFEKDVISEMFSAYTRLISMLYSERISWQHNYTELLSSSKIRFFDNAFEDIPNKLLHGLFEESCTKYPHNTAVISEEKHISYNNLNMLADYYAEKISFFEKTDKPILILMEKGWEQIVAVLSVLKSGHPYLPISLDNPHHRIKYIIEQTKSTLIITQEKLRNELETVYKEIDVLGINNAMSLPKYIGKRRLSKILPDDIAYIIYTSGSTGNPKGVVISHRNAANTILDINSKFNINAEDRILALSDLSFDLSVYDIFGILSAGGCIVIPTEGSAKSPDIWHNLINKHRVSVWNTVPALMEMYMEYLNGVSQKNSLRLVLLSGDWIPVSLPEKIRQNISNKHIKVISLGGATEASIWSIYYPIERVLENWESIPYGKALKNQTVTVVDKYLNPCPVWVVGEICIAGAGVAMGYFNDVNRTAKSFIKIPETGTTIYKTGDLGRLLPDGNIEFIGRIDTQVKIGGYRIELGEIENTILNIKDIKSAVACANTERTGISAFFVRQEGKSITTEEIKTNIKEKLPSYMLPSDIICLEQLPLTNNGKINRKALLQLRPVKKSSANNSENQEMSNQNYDLMIDVFAEILELNKEDIDIDQNFFSMGGDSILGVKIITRLKEAGITLSPRMIFESPTIRELSKVWQNTQTGKNSKKIFLSIFQQLALKNLKKDVAKFNHILAITIDNEIKPEIVDKHYADLCASLDLLKNKFHISDNNYSIIRDDSYSYEIEYVDNIPSDTTIGKYITKIASDIVNQQKITDVPLIRCVFFDSINEGNRLLFVVNKIFMDLQSLDLFVRLLIDKINIGNLSISPVEKTQEEIMKWLIADSNNNEIPFCYQLNISPEAVSPTFVSKEITINGKELLNLQNKLNRSGISMTELLIGFVLTSLSSHYPYDKDYLLRLTTPYAYKELLRGGVHATCSAFYKSSIIKASENSLLDIKNLKERVRRNSKEITLQDLNKYNTRFNILVDIIDYGSALSNVGKKYQVSSLNGVDDIVTDSPIIISLYAVGENLKLTIKTGKEYNIDMEILSEDLIKYIKDFSTESKGFNNIDILDFESLSITEVDLRHLTQSILSFK